jgi:hypothetical protein
MQTPRLISFMPLAVLVMTALTFVAVFAVDSTAGRVALVIVILAVGVVFSSAMLVSGRGRAPGRR